MTDLRATELQYEQTIIDAAKATGWKVHGERAAFSRGKMSTPIKGHPGWPDLVLVHPTRHQLLIAELKRKPNKPTKDQLDWLNAWADFFVAVDVDIDRARVAVFFVPEDMDLLLELVTDADIW